MWHGLLQAVVLGLSCTTLSRADNATAISGTWSTGMGTVSTGSEIGDPFSTGFNVPKTTGMALALTDDGFFEETRFFYDSNATHPSCVKSVLYWQHGIYSLFENGTLKLDPGVFGGDGRIQISNTCSRESSLLTSYNQIEFYNSWLIIPWRGNYALCLTDYSNRTMARMFRRDTDAIMHQQTNLVNSTNTLNGQD